MACELQQIFAGGVQSFIEIGDDNTIKFTLQEGPIKEHGINGCQIDHLIGAAATIVRYFNKSFPCRENSLAITKLEESLMWLEKRTRDRMVRGVEGKNEA